MSVPQSTPQMVRWCALILTLVAMAGLLCTAARFYEAEATGEIDHQLRDGTILHASRQTSLADYNQQMQLLQCEAVLNGAFGVLTFWFYRRLS